MRSIKQVRQSNSSVGLVLYYLLLRQMQNSLEVAPTGKAFPKCYLIRVSLNMVEKARKNKGCNGLIVQYSLFCNSLKKATPVRVMNIHLFRARTWSIQLLTVSYASCKIAMPAMSITMPSQATGLRRWPNSKAPPMPVPTTPMPPHRA